MQSWLPRLDDGAPKYAAIAAAIEAAVRDGRLRPGERLPPQRDLARALAVDLTTVTRAYTIAREAGLIEGAGRLGSYVRNGVALSASAGAAADTGMNMPPQPAFALLADAIRAGHATLLRAGGQSPMLQYQPDGGSLHDRLAAAAAFSARGLQTADDEVVVTAGGQNALHAILGATLTRGDVICTGSHVYPGLLALATRFGLVARALPDDGGGIDPDALAEAAGQGARALYVVPTNDNPTTVTLDEERRRAIAQVARRHGLAIIEDDAYGLLPAARLMPIAAFAPELTWHVASTSKIISPALRVAHVRAPSVRQAWRLAADVHETAVMAPPLNAALVSLWLRDGTFERLVEAVRVEAVARQRIVARELAGLDYATHPEGYHLWLRLDAARMPAPAELAAMLRPAGLSAVSARAFAARPEDVAPAVRISFGGAMDHERLRRALQRLEALLHHGHARATALV